MGNQYKFCLLAVPDYYRSGLARFYCNYTRNSQPSNKREKNTHNGAARRSTRNLQDYFWNCLIAFCQCSQKRSACYIQLLFICHLFRLFPHISFPYRTALPITLFIMILRKFIFLPYFLLVMFTILLTFLAVFLLMFLMCSLKFNLLSIVIHEYFIAPPISVTSSSTLITGGLCLSILFCNKASVFPILYFVPLSPSQRLYVPLHQSPISLADKPATTTS